MKISWSNSGRSRGSLGHKPQQPRFLKPKERGRQTKRAICLTEPRLKINIKYI